MRPGYRRLRVGEVLREGDSYLSATVRIGQPASDVVIYVRPVTSRVARRKRRKGK